MYLIAWVSMAGGRNNRWKIVSGADAMQEEVSMLCKEEKCEPHDIFVFNLEDELDQKED